MFYSVIMVLWNWLYGAMVLWFYGTVSYSGNCAEQVPDFAQGMLLFVLPLKFHWSNSSKGKRC